MKMRVSVRSAAVLVLLISVIAITAFAASTFTRLDQVVHNDLYRYGLQFDLEWATMYWNYSRLMLGFLEVAMIATGITIAVVQFGVQTDTRAPAKLASSILLTMGILMIGLSAIFFNQLDHIVHGDLYRYGLQFNYEWAGKYWAYSQLMLSLLAVAIGATVTSIGLILTGGHPHHIGYVPKERSPRIGWTMAMACLAVLVGMMVLALSINYNSTILAFIGLGLTFWGAVLLYIRPEKYVKEALLDRTAIPTLESLHHILQELGFRGNAIYLPPKYLKDFESSKVFIGADEDTELPTPEQIQVQDDRTLLKDPSGMLITPSGARLTELFEKMLGTSFIKVDLKYLEQNLPRVLIEDLEVAQSLAIETDEDRVHVKIENSIYKNVCKEAENLSNVSGSLGCPLCSAIACALAKATGKPVIIVKEQTSEDGLAIDVEYRLLEEETQ